MSLTRIAMLVVSFNLGILVFFILSYVQLPLPYSWNHFGIILFITLPLSFIMDMLIFERSHHDNRIGLAHAFLVALYAILFFSIHFEEAGNIKFNALASLVIMISSWILSAIPFLYKDGTIALSRLDTRITDYALFATSLMWYAPFFAELLVLLDWQLKGVFAENFEQIVLGGAGFNDMLFILGSATLVSTGLNALVASKGRNSKSS